ncbi:MAG: B12-binding domain-containing radical SAM protein [Planctomycetes bacterium]|nr:B12-binding domain-containing radical SAM protein [Planctomycetota bacterium]
MRVLFVYNEVEALGLEYLSAVLKQHGHTTGIAFDPRLFDFFRHEFRNSLLSNVFNFRRELLDKVVRFEPDLIGFQVLSANYPWCVEIASEIKKRLPDVPIVFGGYHPTASPGYVMEHACVDYVIKGEAEIAFLDLVQMLEAGEVDPATPNIVMRRNGAIIENDVRPYIQDLDVLPFPDKDLFYQMGNPFDIAHMIMTRRGCPYGCTFCGNNLWRKTYFKDDPNYMFTPKFVRGRTPENVVEEMRIVKQQYGVKLLRVNDDDFPYDERWLTRFSEVLTDDARIPYKCFVNPNSVNETTAHLLKITGCEQVQMGVQSMNGPLRKLMGRPMPEKIIERAISCIQNEGVGLFCDQIYGLPGETEDDYKAMVSFYRKNPTDFVNVYWVNYFPGTDMVQQAVDAGVLTQEQAEELQKNPVAGDVSTISEYHHKRGKKYKVYMEGYNYLSLWMCDFLMKSGLWWVAGKLNVFRFFRFVYGLGLKANADHFPPPKKGYDISSFRFPAMCRHYMALKIKSWFGKKINIYEDRGRAGAPAAPTPLELAYAKRPPVRGWRERGTVADLSAETPAARLETV